MSRILKRPMFRVGGPVMDGIMSGIQDRKPMAGGGQIGGGTIYGKPMGNRTGYAEPKFNRFLNETPLGRELQKIAIANNRNIADVVTGVYDLGAVPINKTAEFFTGANPGFSGTRFSQNIPIIKESISDRDPNKAIFFGAETDATPKTGIFSEKKPEPKTLPSQTKGTGNGLSLSGNEDKSTGDMETNLMKAFKDYKTVFEKELGESKEDTKKDLYLQLAKFGSNLMAQPGGNLLGSIGKAAEKPLEGVSKIFKDKKDAERKIEFLALQTALKENEGGTLFQHIQDIKKIKGFKGEDANEKAYNTYLKYKTTSGEISERKTLIAQAISLGFKGNNQNKFVLESQKLPKKHPDLIGSFNTILNSDWENEDIENVGGYYVSPKGRFVRVIRNKEGKKEAVGMDKPTLFETNKKP